MTCDKVCDHTQTIVTATDGAGVGAANDNRRKLKVRAA